MKSYYRHILLTSAAILVAAACTKTVPEGLQVTDMQISICASEGLTKSSLKNGTFNPTGTKSLLDASTFAEEGNQIKVYDYYTANGSTTSSIYIDDKVKSEGPSQATWPFVAQRYNWTADGSHKFFGWMAEDVNMTSAADAAANTPEEFFGGSFSFNTATQALTVPVKALNQTTPQFDFMYSDIYVRDLNTDPDYVSPVELEFSHLFTAFNITAENRSSQNTVKIISVSVNGLKNNNSATINFAGAQTSVTYGTGSDSDAVAAEFAFAPTGGITLGTSAATISDYFLMWPQTFTEDSFVTFTLTYDFTDGATGTTATYTKSVNLTSGTWDAGVKNNVNLVFKDKEIILQCVVEDWEVVEEEIDFSDQVTVSDTGYITWDQSTVESCNTDTGDVILYTDESMVATCTFTIDTPKGATWTASLIPVEGHQDAFTLLDGTKYGAVGVESTIKIKVNNQAPIAPRHICILRITVQTSDGRTIVVKNLVPEGKGYEEFRIIQNLING